MLTQTRTRQLLAPFGLELTSAHIAQIHTYFDLLLRWNRRINLTAIRDPEECVTRHFGESLYLRRWVELSGKLLDIGSGAGFPGLALKIVFPALAVTLLEPVAKKRAFLKETVRVCGMECVEVRAERLAEFVPQTGSRPFDAATCRAVGHLAQLVPMAARCLRIGGGLYLWVSREQGKELAKAEAREPLIVRWGRAIPIPLSRSSEIWCGRRAG